MIVRIIYQLNICPLLINEGILFGLERRVRRLPSRASAWLLRRPRPLSCLAVRKDRVFRVIMLWAGPVIA
jgi:hypothetical protein